MEGACSASRATGPRRVQLQSRPSPAHGRPDGHPRLNEPRARNGCNSGRARCRPGTDMQDGRRQLRAASRATGPRRVQLQSPPSPAHLPSLRMARPGRLQERRGPLELHSSPAPAQPQNGPPRPPARETGQARDEDHSSCTRRRPPSPRMARPGRLQEKAAQPATRTRLRAHGGPATRATRVALVAGDAQTDTHG